MLDVQHPNSSTPKTVALWNPNAATNWSLLFSPAFGSYLQMLNWNALGQPEQAAKSCVWFYVSVGILLLYALIAPVLPDSNAVDALTRLIGLGLLC